MKGRALRIKVPTYVSAALAGHSCELIDVSVTGALTVVDVELTIDSRHPFQLGEEGEALDLIGRVVRVTAATERGRWRTAVAFEDLAPARQREITSHVGRLLASPRGRSLRR